MILVLVYCFKISTLGRHQRQDGFITKQVTLNRGQEHPEAFSGCTFFFSPLMYTSTRTHNRHRNRVSTPSKRR